jgi:hypothetical protein
MEAKKPVAIEACDHPHFGDSPNDHLIHECDLDHLLKGGVLWVPSNGYGCVYLKFKGGSRGA